jgi:type II secretory pathway pseudopilin PulG
MFKNFLKKIKKFLISQNKKKRTLTLIELLISVAIVNIFLVLIFGQINNIKANGRDTKRISDFHALNQALEMYFNDHGYYPIQESAICTNDPHDPLNPLKVYLSKIPEDPLLDSQCYIYKTDENGRNFKVQTKLERNLELMKNDGGTDPDYYEIFSLNEPFQPINIDSFTAQAIYENWKKYKDSTILADWEMDDPNLFNPNPQTLNDSSSYQNNGQLGSSNNPDYHDPSWQSSNNCIKDNCLEYDGDDFVEIENGKLINPNCQFSLEGWVKYKNLNGIPRILEKFASFWLYFDSEANQLKAGFKDRNNEIHEFAYSIIPQVNTWYYLVWTFDCEKIRLYVNGKLDSEYEKDLNNVSIKNKKIAISDNKIFLGKKSDNSGFLNGILDEVKIYNRALSSKEICQKCQTFKDANFCNNCLY